MKYQGTLISCDEWEGAIFVPSTDNSTVARAACHGLYEDPADPSPRRGGTLADEMARLMIEGTVSTKPATLVVEGPVHDVTDFACRAVKDAGFETYTPETAMDGGDDFDIAITFVPLALAAQV